MDRTRDDVALDALFDAGRARSHDLSDELLARLQSDADASMPAARVKISTAPSLMSRFAGLFAASGLSGVAALGVWIGFAMPEMLNLDTFVTLTEDVGLYTFFPGADLTALVE